MTCVNLDVGSEFAGYAIERLLGSGGMGEVYLAAHPRLPRHDALKVLAPQFSSDPHYRARFEREAELAASLRHPAIVPVHDRGEYDGRLWIAMAFVDGEDLADRLRTHGPFTANQVRLVTRTVADALDRANARGLVHRDVKPANILRSTDGDVLLTDFGIARSESADVGLTSTGTAVGTVDFASPEQLQGLQVDGRSDQYSLACTAFALLTGRAPFAASSAARVISSQLNDPLPSVRTARPDLAPAVDAVLQRATAKNPAARFATSAEFAAALDHALAQTPPAASPTLPPVPSPPSFVHAPPTMIAGPQHRPRSGRRIAVIVGAVVAILVVVAGGIWFALPDSLKASQGDYVQEPTDSARALDLPDVTPPLASLETEPTAGAWRYAPPGIDQNYGVRVVGAVGDTVLVGRDGALDIVDASTAKLLRTARISGDDAPTDCGVNGSGAWAACRVGYHGRIVIVDLARAAVTGSVTALGSSTSYAVVGDSVVMSTGSGDDYTVTVVNNRGDTVWERDSTKNVILGGSVVAVAPASNGDAFFKAETIAIRVSDGRELTRVSKPDDKYAEDPQLTPYASGFVLGDHFYTNDGKRLAAIPGDWRPLYVAQGNALTVPAPALPVMANLDKQVGVIDPASGDVLWSRKLDGAYSAHAKASGRGVIIDNMSGDENDARRFAWYDLATGVGASRVIASLYDTLGSDGTRIAVSGEQGITVFGPESDGALWNLPLDDAVGGSVVNAGGHLYRGGQRLI
ncbi:serine/threonine protein kinase [Gordonia malaquae]|nr:serine/threonine protein kinase [Gordonia malaquae]